MDRLVSSDGLSSCRSSISTFCSSNFEETKAPHKPEFIKYSESMLEPLRPQINSFLNH